MMNVEPATAFEVVTVARVMPDSIHGFPYDIVGGDRFTACSGVPMLTTLRRRGAP
jgi:hypothetical protein